VVGREGVMKEEGWGNVGEKKEEEKTEK